MKKLFLMAVAMTMVIAMSAQTDKFKTFTANGVSFKMIKVNGGTFRMGHDDGYPFNPKDYKPEHYVTLTTYYISETEVTQALWKAVMGSLPSEISSSSYDVSGFQRPVCYVSWDECQEFIDKLNALTGQKFHLPTEAQWEFAARERKKYDGPSGLHNRGWYTESIHQSNPPRGTKNVKSYYPNELGIYDMGGNVFEWCQDWYGDYSKSEQTDPTGPSSEPKHHPRRVLRGGGWHSSPHFGLVYYRFFANPLEKDESYGLRLAL